MYDNYLTNYYKNLSEQLQARANYLKKILNEAEDVLPDEIVAGTGGPGTGGPSKGSEGKSKPSKNPDRVPLPGESTEREPDPGPPPPDPEQINPGAPPNKNDPKYWKDQNGKKVFDQKAWDRDSYQWKHNYEQYLLAKHLYQLWQDRFTRWQYQNTGRALRPGERPNIPPR